MPKMRWSGLPEALRKHLLLRLKDRQVSEEDLLKLMEWRRSEPEAPEGLWFKGFGSFKLYGEGELPKTFLLKGQAAKGTAALGRERAASPDHFRAAASGLFALDDLTVDPTVPQA